MSGRLSPPGWSEQDWKRILVMLRTWFKSRPEDWTDDTITGYALGLADFTPDQVAQAIRRLADDPSGRPFLPVVQEIRSTIHVDRDAPSWTEAHALLFDRPGGVIHARIPRGERPVGEDARWALREQAMLDRAAGLHPMIEAFTAAYGPRRLEAVSGRIAYGEYGAVELERLRDEWEDFVERAEARRREGMPLLTAPLARRELGQGPRRLGVAQLAAAIGGQPDEGGAP